MQDPVELVDIYPTIADLAGVPVSPAEGLDGDSLVPLMSGLALPNASAYALSVYPRCPANMTDPTRFWENNDCLYVERTTLPFMGISLRTSRWRYTEWLPWNASLQVGPVPALSRFLRTPRLYPLLSLQVSWEAPPAGVELYDHGTDTGTTFDGPWEQLNLAGEPAFAAVQAQLAAQLRAVYPNQPAW